MSHSIHRERSRSIGQRVKGQDHSVT